MKSTEIRRIKLHRPADWVPNVKGFPKTRFPVNNRAEQSTSPVRRNSLECE